MRNQVADDIWRVTEESDYLKEDEWTAKVHGRMKRFEMDLITAMKYVVLGVNGKGLQSSKVVPFNHVYIVYRSFFHI